MLKKRTISQHSRHSVADTQYADFDCVYRHHINGEGILAGNGVRKGVAWSLAAMKRKKQACVFISKTLRLELAEDLI